MYSIQKKRGVDDQIPGALFALGSCDCPIDTRVEETDVNDVATFPAVEQAPDGLTYNLIRRMWGHPQGNFIYALEWDAFFGRTEYNNPRTILWRINILDGSFESVPKVPPIDTRNFAAAQLLNLHTDEPAYGTVGGGIVTYYSINSNQRYRFAPAPGFGSFAANIFAKEGNFAYGVNQTVTGSGEVTRKLQEWDVSASVVSSTPIRISGDIFDSGNVGRPSQMVVTNSWIYCIVAINPGSGSIRHIMRISRADLTVDSIFNLGIPNAATPYFLIDAVSDSLVYIVDLRATSISSRLLYIDDMETLFQVDVDVTNFFIGAFSGAMCYVHRGCVYVGATGGQAGGSVTIHKICELVCPDTDTPIGT